MQNLDKTRVIQYPLNLKLVYHICIVIVCLNINNSCYSTGTSSDTTDTIGVSQSTVNTETHTLDLGM